MRKSTLRATAALQAIALLGAGLTLATPGYAQTVPPAPTTEADEAEAQVDPNAPGPGEAAAGTAVDSSGDETIVVTGSILRRTNTETPSPVTVLTSESLEQRGINTVSEAVQRLSANGAGTIQSGWNTGFNFASGATAPALRGLSVQNTLSVFDGLRMAPYPLADDGQRNFVDLNSIPNAIIDRIEVLRDGASSTYGADAIAGVINIITKKEIQGLHLNMSAGVSQRGDAGEQRIDAAWGYGDLDDQGFNFYVAGEYQNQDGLWARDRGFPFNTQDLSSICNSDDSCMTNGNWNGISANGAFNGNISIPGVTFVRPEAAPGAVTGAGRFEFLNPAAGCRQFDEVNPVSASAPILNGQVTSCEVNFQQAYQMLTPDIERKGVSTRFTMNVGDNHQVYAMGNYYQTDTSSQFTPLGLNGTPTPPIPATLGAYNVMLPVYVCPTGVGTRNGVGTGCNAINGVLNPYNPYAALGQTAQAFVRNTRPRTVETKARALRGVIGASGTIFGDVNYSAEAVASAVRLDRTQGNYFIPQRVADAVARGLINFNDLEAMPENIWDFISPEQRTRSTSNLWQATGTLSKTLFELPGGPLQAAVGLSYRHEAIDAPSANLPLLDQDGLPDPLQNQYERYYSINSVAAKGSRDVKSAFFEVAAPIVDQFEVMLAGRYDSYSTGQSNFSPKIGAKFTPVKELAIRGTYSKGFRIPSFNEAFGDPTTGYVTQNLDCVTPDPTYAAFCGAHANNGYADNAFPVGLTQTGNPELEPEKSTNITAGIVFEPIRNVAFTVDFWNIKIKNLIVPVTNIQPILEEYYTNGGVVTGFPGITVLPGQPDPAFPGALPHIGFIQSPYQNAASQIARGIDFGINARLNVTNGLRLTSFLEASYLLKYVLTDADGVKLRYDGTLSPCNVTSCSGAPKLRASWQNTLEFGNTTVSATVYYTKGLDLSSVDFGGVKGDCDASLNASVPTYQDGSAVMCKSKDIWNVDLTASQKIDDRFTLFANVLNVLDKEPPFDHAAAYGLFNFNPAWAGPNIMGRYFRMGAKVDF